MAALGPEGTYLPTPNQVGATTQPPTSVAGGAGACPIGAGAGLWICHPSPFGGADKTNVGRCRGACTYMTVANNKLVITTTRSDTIY